MLRDSRDIIRRLEREGYVLRAVRGAHHKFFHDGLRRMVTIPHPKRDLPLGTVYSIDRQPGWPRERSFEPRLRHAELYRHRSQGSRQQLWRAVS